MLLSPSYKTIELSTLVDNKKEYKMSFNIYNICIFKAIKTTINQRLTRV